MSNEYTVWTVNDVLSLSIPPKKGMDGSPQ